jgi:hypothetical protein
MEFRGDNWAAEADSRRLERIERDVQAIKHVLDEVLEFLKLTAQALAETLAEPRRE